MSCDCDNKPEAIWTPEFRELVRTYEDTPDHNGRIWTHFYQLVNSIPYLRHHRDFVEFFAFGFGDRPFHYMWKLLVEQMPDDFSFLEVGVFKGQVVSLVLLLARGFEKQPKIYGITPLSSVGDKYSQYPDTDYRDEINAICRAFKLPRRHLSIIRGLSTDDHTKA